MTDLLRTGPERARATLVLAHGAGAPMTSPFMEQMAALLCERDICVVRFEFTYMAARRMGGKRRPPPKAETLADAYREVAHTVQAGVPEGQRVFIGGKSMGGRVASLVADDLWQAGGIAGLVCLGYPFHPPGMPDKLRTVHLQAMTCPGLIVQGERDPFGGRDEVSGYGLSRAIALAWLPDGDHDFGPRGGSGHTRKGNLAAAADAVAAFVDQAGQAA